MFDKKRLQYAVIATCATLVGFIGSVFVFSDSLEIVLELVSGFSLIFLVLTYYAIFSSYDQERKIVQLENKVDYLKQTLYDEIQLLKNDKS